MEKLPAEAKTGRNHAVDIHVNADSKADRCPWCAAYPNVALPIYLKKYTILSISKPLNVPGEDYFKQGLARRAGSQVKVLAEGELTRKVKIHAHKFSGAALEKIKNSGGEAIILGGESN
jgi:hypothetical protein